MSRILALLVLVVFFIIESSCSGKLQSSDLPQPTLNSSPIQVVAQTDASMESVISNMHKESSFGEHEGTTVNGDAYHFYKVLLTDETSYYLFEDGSQMIVTSDVNILGRVERALNQKKINYRTSYWQSDKYKEWTLHYDKLFYPKILQPSSQ